MLIDVQQAANSAALITVWDAVNMRDSSSGAHHIDIGDIQHSRVQAKHQKHIKRLLTFSGGPQAMLSVCDLAFPREANRLGVIDPELLQEVACQLDRVRLGEFTVVGIVQGQPFGGLFRLYQCADVDRLRMMEVRPDIKVLH